MSTTKKYWLKLNKDFLKSPQIKVIKDMPNGKDYVIFYLSLMLESIETVGHLRFTSFIPYNAEMLSTITETNVDIVRSAIKLFCEIGLMQIFDDGTIFMTQVPEMTGKECDSAERVRQFRARKEIEKNEVKKIPKTNALRQKQFRAKQFCEGKQHIPYIEQDQNNKRYNGNYYVVFKRDKLKCAVCGSIENLCVHHIDGYDENKPENSNENKLITLCRSCHRNIHENNLKLSEEILESIDYYDECNKNNEICNSDVTKCNSNIYIDKDINKNKKIDKYINPYKNHFELNYKNILKSKPFLSSKDQDKIIELYSIYDEEIIIQALQKLKNIAFEGIDFKPSASWLLKDNNFERVMNGEFDKQKEEHEFEY